MGAILVAYDGSDAAKRALAAGIEEAQSRAAELVVLAVAPLVLRRAKKGEPPLDVGPVAERYAVALHEAEEQARSAGVRVRAVEALGEPIETIVRFARESAVDLVLLGSGSGAADARGRL